MNTVIGIDPGKTTGIFIWDRDADASVAAEVAEWRDVPAFIDEWMPAHIVYERFLIGPQTLKKARQYEALYAIGAIEYEAKRRWGIDPDGQTPQTRIVASDDILKALGWWRPSMRHAMDAARHVVVWSLRRRWLAVDQIKEAVDG